MTTVDTAVHPRAVTFSDPLRIMLEESCTQQRGLMLMVNGLQFPGIVVEVTDHFVLAKSQAQGNIVVRLDRIDGVAGFVGDKNTQLAG
jgi:hypothetical protein